MAAASLGYGAWFVLCDSISKNEESAMSGVVTWILKRYYFHNSISYGILYEIEDKHADVNCPVGPCAIKKGVENCAHCQDFACDRLKERMNFIEDFLRKNKEAISKEDFDKYVEPYKSRKRLEAIRKELD